MEIFDNGDVITWAEGLEEGALQQARNLADLYFVQKPVAVMADGHQGYGAPVGAVIATSGAIIPYAVGVDIGCGMIAVRLNLTSADLPDNLDALHDLIRKAVPSGVGQGHSFDSEWDRMRHTKKVPSYSGTTGLTGKQINTITDQMGTLGSGNHFVEVCLDELDRVWLMLHSGSRGIGNQLGTHHINLAKGILKELGTVLPDPNLAYLLEGSKEFDNYIRDMLWAQDYAMQNRTVMMDAVVEAMTIFFGAAVVKEQERANCHHNFAQEEIHDGRKAWVTRKGAIQASVGKMGIIPGSMGTSSYVTEGLGNERSYASSSHGAGRRLSRGAAKKQLSVDDLIGQMQGRTWNSADAAKLLDEAPAAYKDIAAVMEAQKDLTKIKHKLTAVLNYKGV